MAVQLPSLFHGFRNPQCHTISWTEVLSLLTGGQLQETTEKFRYFRNNGQETEARSIKASVPAITPAIGCNGGRRQENIIGYTGISMADFDHIPAGKLDSSLGLLKNDPHVFLCYTTLSGEGIRVLFRYTNNITEKSTKAGLYKLAFQVGNTYFACLLGLEFDAACKNPTRLSALCHDPAAYFNPESEPFLLTDAAPISGPKPHQHTFVRKAVRTIARELESMGVVYEAGHHNEYIAQTGYRLNRYGVDEEEAVGWATRRFADYGERNVESIIRSCYRETGEHATLQLPQAGEQRRPHYASVTEIEQFLDTQGEFRYNMITRQVESRQENGKLPENPEWMPLADRDMNTLWRRMGRSERPSRLNDIYTVLHSEYVPSFHPFREYLDRLSPWNGTTDPIGNLAGMVHVKGSQQVFTEYFRKWFVGILPTLFEAHTVNHEILVLIGPQGVYKTTWLSRLLPPELQRYFYTKTNSNRLTKDDLFTLTEFALVCFEEIDGMQPSELNQLKAITTARSINERAAYGHTKEHRTHIASFCATGNNPQFLSDRTGNRRWLPFEVTAIDSPYTHPIPYEEVYAQALSLWKSGFRYWFELEEIRDLNRRNQEFETPNLEEELILTYYRLPLPGEAGKIVTTAQILERINAAIRQPLSSIKIGLCMKKLKFESLRTPTGQRGYRIVQLSQEEVNSRQQALGHLSLDSTPTAPEKTEEAELPF